MYGSVIRGAVLFGVLTVGLAAAGNGAAPGVPDFTKGDRPDITPAKTDRYLHLNGARGWVYLDEKTRSTESRQIWIRRAPTARTLFR